MIRIDINVHELYIYIYISAPQESTRPPSIPFHVDSDHGFLFEKYSAHEACALPFLTFEVSQLFLNIKSPRKTRNILVRELMFADDTTLVPNKHQNAHKISTRFSKSANVFGLKINLKKTKVIFQTPLESHDICQDIEGQVLYEVNKFKYLGFTVSTTKKLDAELDTRTSNTSKAFGGPRERV